MEDGALPCLHEVGVANVTGQIYLGSLLVLLLGLDTEVSRLVFLLPCSKIPDILTVSVSTHRD